jgi:prolipoprotein diacylglyceryltransferase
VNGKHPTQLYESAYAFIVFFILLKFRNIREKGKHTKFKQVISKKGSLFLSFLLLYSFLRFFNDFFRAYENYWLGLALSQWILLGIFVLSIIILKNIRNKG